MQDVYLALFDRNKLHVCGAEHIWHHTLMTDHTLEISWWLKDPPAATSIPPSSLMSFTKFLVMDGQEIGQEEARVGGSLQLNELRGKYGCIGGGIPKRCIIQIGSLTLHLHAKWVPLLMILQLFQAAALQASIAVSDDHNKMKPMLRLMWFFDFLLQQFARDATMAQSQVSAGHPLPDYWMPESMHRCLTRIELNIPHSRASLEKHNHALQEAYANSRDHFCFGERHHLCVWFLLILILHLSSDYYNFTRTNQITLEAALKFLGTPEPSVALEMLQHELIAYGFHSNVEHGIGHNAKGIFHTPSLSKQIITTQQKHGHRHNLLGRNCIVTTRKS